MDITFTKGDYIIFETVYNESYEGFFVSNNKDKTRITVCNIKKIPEEIEIAGSSFYHQSELKSIERAQTPLDLRKESLILKDKSKISERYIIKVNSLCHECILIDKIDDTYEEIISYLNEYPYISVSAEGSKGGRFHESPILTLATVDQIYIFDIQTLGHDAFINGIKKLLINDKICKIIHDCRFISDWLFHKHQFKLKNVFDTQVADCIITKNENGFFPVQVRTLTDCINIYLDLPRNSFIDEVDYSKWTERPFPENLKEICAHNVVYLNILAEVMDEEMTASAEKGNQFFLNYHRFSDNIETSFDDSKPTIEFLKAVSGD